MDSKSKETGDMHKANIVMLVMKSEGVLLSLCSKGTLAEWDVGEQASFTALNHRELELGSPEAKIRHAALDSGNSRLIVNEQTSRSFLIYDLKTFKLSAKIAQVESIPLMVTKMVIINDRLVYALGKNMVA